MWADTLLAAERAHLLRLLAWGALSVLAGTALLAVAGGRGARERTDASGASGADAGTGLLRHFALQTVAWGIAEGAIAALSLRTLALRDYVAAMRLDRVLWLNVGLDSGYIGMGVTLAIAAWTLGRRAAPVGAGIGIVVQGCALLALHLLLLSVTSRFA
ncbi:MAG TPA: hypothetical protein VFZ11_09400 [Gemmatimonadaceae bacterium]